MTCVLSRAVKGMISASLAARFSMGKMSASLMPSEPSRVSRASRSSRMVLPV